MMDIKERSEPLVSVVMPACNAERFVRQAVESVLAQSVSELELIVVDDGSADGTKAIIEQIAQRDGRVRLVENETNIGVAGSRNRGMELCRGSYTAFLDSDDYWNTDFLEKMIARAEETKADIVYCSYCLVDETGQKVCNDFLVPQAADYEYSLYRSVITCSTALLTKAVTERYRFPADVYHEDIALWFRILKEGGTACGVQEVLAAYRQRSGSRSSGKLKSAWRRWEIYRRYLGLPAVKCAVLMVKYGVYGVIKYRKV